MSIPIKVKSDYHLTLADVKNHLRVDIDFLDDDNYIEVLIEAAVEKAEAYIGKDIATTTNTLVINEWSSSILELNEGNFISFTSGTLADNSTVSVDYINTLYNGVKITFLDSYNTDTGTFIYETGYTTTTVPKLIKQAVLIKIADLYDEDRSSYSTGVKHNKTFETLLDSYKYINFV